MLLVDALILQHIPSIIKQNQFPNTPKAFVAAFVAFLLLFAISIGITFTFQSTAVLQGESLVQSVMRHGFSATGLEQATAGQPEPIFADSKIGTYITFAFVIAFIETRFIIRLVFALAYLFGISQTKFSYTLGIIYFVVARTFVWFHANVKGVEDNTALLITFFFAIITFELARRFQEMESATHLHVINNFIYIWNKIGF